MYKLLLVIALFLTTFAVSAGKANACCLGDTMQAPCGSGYDGCGGTTCCCGTCCVNCGGSSSGCSNSSTCTAAFADYTYLVGGAAVDYGVTDPVRSNVDHKTIAIPGAIGTCSPKWPTWSNWGGQDDIVWHDYSGNAGNFIYSHIPLASAHGIQWYDSLILVHTYINSNAKFCGAVNLYKCYGNFSISSGTYSKDAGPSRFSTMTVSGTAVFAQGVNGNTIVGCP